MKTIIDAVNELRGDLDNLFMGQDSRSTHIYWRVSDEGHAKRFLSLSDEGGDSEFAKICTITEFNGMVAEMSEGFEEYKREYEMDKVETVTVDGMVYQLNELYVMHNGSENDQQVHELCEISESGNFIDENGSHWGFAANAIMLGTITHAPINLVNGKAYIFSCNGRDDIVALYDELCLAFYTQYMSWGVRDCTNIIPLVPEVKS